MNKTVLITGSSSGFGKEAARLFHQQGWNVVATMRSPEKEAELKQLDRVLVTELDVTDEASIRQAVEAAVSRFGTIDALINNAGYGLMGVFESSANDQIRQLFEVNVFGLMAMTRAVLPYLRRNGGSIVNLSSFGGVVALPFGSPYNSSKFAVEGFSEALAHEVAAFGIRVRIVEPGSVSTNFRSSAQMVPNAIPEYDPLIGALFQRYGQATEHLVKATPEEVAATIYAAATDETLRLRYVAGADAQYFIDLKQQPEAVFLQSVRDLFIAPGEPQMAGA